MRKLLPLLLAAACAATAHATPILRVTEVMSNGDTWDWFELTNYGTTEADITGYRMDDNSFSFALSVALNGVTTIAPGESVLFIESAGGAGVASFRDSWGVDEGVQVGFYSGSGVGFGSGGDGVVVYNGTGTEVTPRLNFGAATSGTTFYWSYNPAGDLASAALGTLTTEGLPGYITWVNGVTIMRGTPGVALTAPAATYLFWRGGAGSWTATGGTQWSTNAAGAGAGPWSPDNTAVFHTNPATVTLADNIEATGLRFDAGGFTLASSAGQVLSLDEGDLSVNAGTVTVNAPLAGTNGLAKAGAGHLVLGGTNVFSGVLSVVQGSVALTTPGAIPDGVRLSTARFTTFNFNGLGAVVGGLGGVGSFTNFTGALTIAIPGATATRFDGRLSGTGDLIIDSPGDGAQRFDTTGQSRTDGLEKDYTGRTIVRRGLLEVDSSGYPGVSGVPTRTSQVIIEGGEEGRGELRMTRDGGLYEFGIDLPQLPVITLAGGILGNENRETVDLYNDLEVTGTGSEIASRGFRIDPETSTVTFGEIYLFGRISGDGELRKTGQGYLLLEETNDGFTGTWNIRNGTVVVPDYANLGTAPQLQFTDSANQRRLVLAADQTVSLLAATAAEAVLDPETGEVITPAGTAVVELAAGATLIIDQDEAAAPLDGEGNPLAGTRFQGSLTGAGSVAKTGTGLIEFTRGPNDFTGRLDITRGALALSQPAAPATLSALTVAAGGQLRLTSGSTEAEPVRVYDFGAVTLQLAGAGRDGVEADAGKGIAGALRYEPGGSDNSAAVANAMSLAGGTALHVSGSTSTLILQGALTGSGGAVTKNGGGLLSLAAANPGLAHAWSVVSGTLHIAAGATSGSGTVTIGSGAVLAGAGGTGSIVIEEGGTLQAGTLVSSGTFTAEPGSLLAVDPATPAGTYTVLTASGGVSGATNLAVTGLEETGLTGAVAATANTLVLTVTAASGDVTFGAWSGGVAPGTDVNGNGYTALAEFALGASAPGASFAVPVQGATNAGGTNFLTLTAVVRTNGSGLTVTGQSAANLSASDTWSAMDVDFVPTGATDVPDGCEERLYRTPAGGTRKFLRLHMELAE